MKTMEQGVLILEDNIEDFGTLYQQLRAIGYPDDQIFKFGGLHNMLSVSGVDARALLVKCALMGSDPITTLESIRSVFPHSPIIVIATQQENDIAAALIASGVQDCLFKGQFNQETLGHVIKMATARMNVQRPVVTQETFAGMDDEEPAMQGALPISASVTDNSFFLFEESPVPMWIFDLGTAEIIAANAAAIYHYGYTESEFGSMQVKDLRLEGDEPVDMEVVKIPMLNSFYNSSKRKHVKKDGEVIAVQVYTHTVIYQQRSAGMMMALELKVPTPEVIIKEVVKEIEISAGAGEAQQAAQKQHEELMNIIQQQNQQFDDLLSSVSEVIWSCSADDSSILYINRACYDVYGYTPGELIQNTGLLASLVHPDDIEKYEAAYLQLKTSRELNVEYRVYHKDGLIKQVVSKAILRDDREGGPGIINGITLDVTRMREIERRLRESANETENILNSITDGFFAINSNWEFTYINKEFEHILQLDGQELIGKNIWETVQGVEEMQAYSELYRAVKEKRTVHFEEYFPPLKKWLSVNAYPNKEGLAVYFRDITNEKKRILQIEEQNEKLKEIAWLQSHKVRGPVASILGLIQLFNYQDPADETNREILEGVRFAATGLDDIIREVVNKTSGIEQ